ncbi:MAG: LPS assembly protein LptD [Pseudomonadota bacterium]
MRAVWRISLWLLAMVLPCALAGPLAAQEPPQPAVLVADDVYLDGNERLVATGNVEAIYNGRRLQAEGIVYDRASDRLILTGPIVIQEGDEMLILASSAEIDQEMQNGILRGARLVMGDHVQMAAYELQRVSGRYNVLTKASVTSCRVCEDKGPPIWQIRAERVVHDQLEQQLYFENAQLRVLDAPILYLPRLRLPDPTLDRATGFLVPSLVNSSLLGFGARVPYFIRIGDHKDLTLTPFLTTDTRTLEFRYRQAFRTGRIEFNGAVSDDDVASAQREHRAYFFGEGEFDVGEDLNVRFDIELVNDDTYLLDYGYSDKTRLDSELEVEYATRLSYARGAITHYQSLRPFEANSTLPTIVVSSQYEQRFLPSSIGGEFRLGMEAQTHYRSSDLGFDTADQDIYADGRDVTRFTLEGQYLKSWTMPGGILTQAGAGLAFDAFRIDQAGTTSLSSHTEVTPTVELEFRLPLVRSGAGGTDVVEPVVQLAWVGGSNANIPNDENTRIEFDEGNLFSTSRFVSPDRRERGFQGSYGVSWTRFMTSGWQSSVAVGQLFRDENQLEVNGTNSFSHSSGLNSKLSDVLVAGQLKSDNGLVLTARGLFDDEADTTKAEARASWINDTTKLTATYVWLGRDLVENRAATISEWAFDASYRLSRHWTGSADWRYDVATDRSVSAGLGLTYSNECVDVSLSASRRFTASNVLEPSTDISLTVGLRGFSAATIDRSYARSCSR